MLKGIFEQYANLDGNRFSRVERVGAKTDYFWHHWFANRRRTRLMRAYRTRHDEKGGSPFVLSVEELATLWHFPAVMHLAPFVRKTLAKRSEPPVQLPFVGEEVPLIAGLDEKTPRVPTAVPAQFVEPRMPLRPTLVVPLPSPRSPGSAPPPSAETLQALSPSLSTPSPHSSASTAEAPTPAAIRELFEPDADEGRKGASFV
jgi:hypothetical protein